MDDIETGTARTTLVIGRDVCAAARRARDAREATYLTVNGNRIAAITPLPQPGTPVPCHYCNMLVSRDKEGGICATHPAVVTPWACPASRDGRGHLIPAGLEA